MKNIVIIILVISCAVMGAMLLNDNKPSTSKLEATKPKTYIAATAGSLDRNAIIKIAEIDGISLETPLNKIGDILKDNGYECEQNDTLFKCNHGSLENTNITINAQNNKIIKISRRGNIAPESIAANLNYFDELRFKLNTRKEVSFSQENNRTLFIVKERNDEGFFRLSYHIQVRNQHGDDGEMQDVIIYNASISR